MNKDKYKKAIEAYLVNKYGKVQEEWEMLIDLLVDNLDLYIQCKKLIDQFGIFDPNKMRKNPLLGTQKETLAQILKLSQQLTISPWSAAKIKHVGEDSTDDFLNALVNE